MKKRHKKELLAEELAALPDGAIDTSDIAELGEAFWKSARVVTPDERKKRDLDGPCG